MSYRFGYRNFYFYIPPSWEFIVHKNTSDSKHVFYMYSQTYYMSLVLPSRKTSVRLDRSASTVAIKTLYPHNFLSLYMTEMSHVMAAFYRPLFKKIKFKGKGYYIYKNKRSTVTPQFGYSHRIYAYAYFTSVKFLSKTSVFVFGFVKADVTIVSLSIKRMRPINIFTGRGVRFAKQVVYKKAGKISSYR